jgi:GNAT superfamily N-acetyltransferase
MTPEVLTEADDATLDALSDLCMRSKAHWGYDADFMAACQDVLRVRREHLTDPTAVVRNEDGFAGIARLSVTGPEAILEKLFVCPAHMGRGVGSALINWAKAAAKQAGHLHLRVESDPDAESFYLSHGAVQVGLAPSEVIPGRMLPLLSLPTGKA